MTHRTYFTIILTMLILVIITVSVNKSMAQEKIQKSPPPQPPITIQTDKLSYLVNDTITISGKVQTPKADTYALIQIYDPHDILSQQIRVDIMNSAYNYSFKIGNNLGSSGEYKVIVSYGPYNAITMFNFICEPYVLVIGDHKFPIVYSIDSGKIESITTNIDNKSLIVHIVNTSSSGKLQINLPRKIIDAVGPNADINFIVSINNEDAQFKEIIQDNYTRTLLIDYPYNNNNPYGIWDIEIIGTQVVPEFSFIIPVLIVSISSILIFYRIKFR